MKNKHIITLIISIIGLNLSSSLFSRVGRRPAARATVATTAERPAVRAAAVTPRAPVRTAGRAAVIESTTDTDIEHPVAAATVTGPGRPVARAAVIGAAVTDDEDSEYEETISETETMN